MNTIYTVGHSNRTIEEFLELLSINSVNHLLDIRSIPKSKHNPQFEQNSLKKSLESQKIAYTYVDKLGGRRPSARKFVLPNVNGAWINQSFHNYADYMQSDEFEVGLTTLLELADDNVVAIMCAEAVPWRCHRNLVADALFIKNIKVCEIISKNKIREHKLTSFAVVKGEKVTYPSTE